MILPTHALNYSVEKCIKHLGSRLFMNSRQCNSVGVCKLTGNVTNLCSVIHTRSHINELCVWNQQMVKVLCIFGDKLLHYLELKK